MRQPPRFSRQRGHRVWFARAFVSCARDAKALDAGKDRKLFNPLAPKRPHFEPKAKAVIFLFMVGGLSQMETFDLKPTLDRLTGSNCRRRSAR